MNVLLRSHRAARGELALGAWVGGNLVGTGRIVRRPGARPLVRADDPAVASVLRSALAERADPAAVVTALAVALPERSSVPGLARALLAAPGAVLRR